MKHSDPTEVFPGIYVICQQGRIGALKPAVNIYVLAGREGLIFDSGYGNPTFVDQTVRGVRKIEQDLSRQKVRAARILLSHTHPDHFSGAFHLKKRLGLKIVSTPEMAGNLASQKYFDTESGGGRSGIGAAYALIQKTFIRYLQQRVYGIRRIDGVDEILQPGQTIAVDDEHWQILAVPGHCEDHIALYSRRRGVLLAGDHIMRSITTWLGPPRSDLKQYVESLEKLLELPDLRLILSAHGKPIENPRERIREAIAHRRERTDQVLRLLEKAGSTGVTVRSVAQGLYPGPERSKRILANGWIVMTLRMLEAEGIIQSRVQTGRNIYYRA